MLKQQALTQKKQFFLLVVLIIFLTATVFLLYKNFWSKKGLRISPEQSFIFKEPLGESFEEEGFIPLSELTKRLFQEDKFKVLEPHGKLPVKVGKTGRSNPFMPF
jgi:hypothetical protein